MIEPMSLLSLQHLLSGERSGDATFAAVSTDTRSLQPGDLFVALRGPNFNANQFVARAREAGACAALVDEAVTDELPLLQVEDSRAALGRLGAYNRDRSTAQVLALTGSQGKTTVKEMTASILRLCGEVLHTRGNLNNELGVPLTLLEIGKAHKYAVIELGASTQGDIRYSSRLVRPHIALINNVAPTHLEGFGTLQGVAAGKAEIWEGLVTGGTAIVNLDDVNVTGSYHARDGIRPVGISAAGKTAADYAVSTIRSQSLEGSTFMLHTPQGNREVSISMPGRHNVANALAAAALAMEAGAGLEHVVLGLQGVHPVHGRLNVRQGLHGATILDDSYNASPSSFRAAIDLLAELPGVRIVVAGDMGELGARKEAEHSDLGEYAADKGIDFFFGTGALTSFAVRSFGSQGGHASDCSQLAALVLPHLAQGVCVLVKGSRSAGMERLVQELVAQQPTEQEG